MVGAVAMGEPVRIDLLGGLRVSRAGQPVAGFLSRKAPALLAYLAVAVGAQPRDRLATLLWSDFPETFAHNSLRQMLDNLDRLVGDHLVITPATVGLHPNNPPTIDVTEFEAYLRPDAPGVAALATATALYGGDFLEGFVVPDATAFEEWVLAQRARLRDLAAGAFARLAALQAGGGDDLAAVATLRRLLALEPWREEVHRQLMLVLARSGQRSAALAQFAICRRVLATELGVEPAAETVALHARILRNEPLAAPQSLPGDHRRPIEPMTLPLPVAPGDGVPLPLPPTALLGREREVAALAALLADPGARLVTLVGPPGVGKTRLVTEVASAAAARLAGGAVFVNLAPLDDAALVPATLAQALGLREIGSRSPLDVIKLHLARREVLLVLDNFEQVLAAGPLVGELLAVCPGVRALVTSREALHLRGEFEFPVAPLDLPDLAHLPTPEALAAHGAIELFVERARAVQPEFTLTAENAQAVAEICARLDGLPLAIELAAARVKLFPPQALLARLSGRAPGATLALLTGGARDLAPRQQTLRAAIAWSYALLDADEQRLFRWLALFPGGCTLEIAEAVAGDDGVGTSVFDLVVSLVDKSLLDRDPRPGAGDGPRFRLLATMREYAGEQLAATGEEVTARRRQLACYLDLARDAEVGLRSAGQGAWLEQLEDEHDNLLTMLAWCAATGEVAGALQLAGALGEFWCRCGYGGIGLAWLTRLLAHSEVAGLTPGERAKALLVAGRLAYLQNDPTAACAMLAECEALYRAQGAAGRRGLSEALTWLGTSGMSVDADIAWASAAITEGVTLARAEGDRWLLAVALTRLGMVQLTAGDAARAEPLLTEALALWRAVGDRWGLGWARFYLGQSAELTGDVAAARAHYDESLAAWRAVREPWGIIMALGYLGNLTRLAGEHATARAHYAECLAILQRTGQRAYSAYIYNRLGGLAALAGELDEAQRLYREGLAILQETGYRRGIAEWLVSLADVAHARDRLPLAARLLGASAALLDAAGLTLFAGDRADVARLEAALRATLGDAPFDADLAAGRALPEDQAIAAAFAVLG